MDAHVEVMGIGKIMENIVAVTQELTSNFGFSLSSNALKNSANS